MTDSKTEEQCRKYEKKYINKMKIKVADKNGKTLSQIFGIPEERMDSLLDSLKKNISDGKQPDSDSEAILQAIENAKTVEEAIVLTYIYARAITKSACLYGIISKS